MQNFTKVIVVDNEKRMFTLTEMKNMNGAKFFITSTDENNKPFAFSLLQKDDDWKLSPGSLRWLYAIEPDLVDAIMDSLPA